MQKKIARWVGDSTHLTRGVLAIGKTLGQGPAQAVGLELYTEKVLNKHI